MIDQAQLRAEIIQPALAAIGYGGAAAEELLLGTAIQESGLRHLRQLGGPALGLWMMEPATHDDCWSDFLAYRGALRTAMVGLAKTCAAEEMVWNLRYACAMARVKYLRSPQPLPAAGDLETQAAFWKAVYNSPLGAGTAQQYVANWRAVVG